MTHADGLLPPLPEDLLHHYDSVSESLPDMRTAPAYGESGTDGDIGDRIAVLVGDGRAVHLI